MKKVVSFHSSRGGTGKTVIAVNLAALLANKGLKIALIDLDFRAPSLYYIFKDAIKEPPTYWVNDYLNSKCKPGDILTGVYKSSNGKGDLSVGFANPSVYAIQDIIRKSRSWEANAIKKLFDLKFLLADAGIDLCIWDTSPGIQYSSLNAVICSDLIVFVASPDPLELTGVESLLKEFDDVFRNKTLLLINKAFPETDYWLDDKQEDLASGISRDFEYPVIEIIPCYCDVLKASRSQLLRFENPNHPFFKKLEEIGQRILLEP